MLYFLPALIIMITFLTTKVVKCLTKTRNSHQGRVSLFINVSVIILKHEVRAKAKRQIPKRLYQRLEKQLKTN